MLRWKVYEMKWSWPNTRYCSSNCIKIGGKLRLRPSLYLVSVQRCQSRTALLSTLFNFPTQQPGKDSNTVTVLTPHCCRLHTNMSGRDAASSVRCTSCVTCDVAGLCQFLCARTAYRSFVTCACTCHVKHCTVWQFERRRQECQLLREASLCILLRVISNFRLVLNDIFFLLGISPTSVF